MAEVGKSMRNKSPSFRSNSQGNNISGILSRSSSQFGGEEDVNANDHEKCLYWAAIEMHPSYKRMTASVLKEYEYDEYGGQVINRHVVHVRHLRPMERHMLIEKLMIRDTEHDNENVLRKLRNGCVQ